MGLGKRNHHSKVLVALHIPQVTNVMKNNTIGLYHRIFQVCTPARELQSHFLAQYLLHGKIVKNTLLHRIVSLGLDPVCLLLSGKKCKHEYQRDGISDSLRYLFYHDNYVKRSGSEFQLAYMLTKSF